MANRSPFLLGFGLYIVSFILCTIGVGTGYWYEARGENRLFVRLGLWEACFNGYEHTSDYIGKAYYGCWWIFHKEYSYIKDWILPPWFVAVQTMMVFSVVLGFITIPLLPMAAKDKDNVRLLNIVVLTTGLTTLCTAISVVIFGVMIGEDRTWMPRPDINVLSWSYGLVVVSGFLSAFCFIALVVYTLTRRWELLPLEEDRQEKKMMPMVPKI